MNPGANVCPRCGHRLRSRLGILGHPIAVYAAIGLGLLFVLAMVLEIRSRQQFKAASAGVEGQGAGGLFPGDPVVLERSGGEDVYLALDGGAIDSMMDSLQSANTDAIQRMVKAGKVIVVPNGTVAKVVETAASSKRVQIMVRPHYGTLAWLPLADIHPRHPTPVNLPSPH
ncbi:hypothetical protein ACYOEI_09250 [Singulisphaera rosea]